MKVVFVNPPNPYAAEPAMNPPLGICYIAAYLESKGYEDITLIDFNLFDYDYYVSNYLEEIPLDADVYGIYCMTPQYRWLKEISEYLSVSANAVIVAGGPHPTNMSEAVLAECPVNHVVIGDGEEAMYQIVSKVHKLDLDKMWRVSNLDELPFPNRDIKGAPLDRYKRTLQGNKAIHLVTLRGCPYSCGFCDRVSVGRDFRFRSVENVMEEVDSLMQKYDWATNYVIYDDVFTMKPSRVLSFCKEFVKRGINWRCWSRTDLVSKDLLKIMRDSGLTSITFGVESGDDVVLMRASKRTTSKDNEKALLTAKELGISVRCSLMYGLPGECKRSIDNTIKLIEKTQPDEWNLAILAPVPGSPIWDNPKVHGIIFDKEWLKLQYYEPCNRFGDSGIGAIWSRPNSMRESEFVDNLNYFVSELERVCPRKNIQDTIQEIAVEKI